jgi:cytochrome o ubiquinol oxidase operon protein cyoD
MSEADPHGSDRAPGHDGRGRGESFSGGFRSYLVGLGLATLLTVVSFALPTMGLVWTPAIPVALIAFAIAQMGVHLVFFLHITTSPDNTNNALALAFGVLIVFLVLAGSIWIMGHLDHAMMPAVPEDPRGMMNMER